MGINWIRNVQEDAGYARYAERRNAVVDEVHAQVRDAIEAWAASTEAHHADDCDSPIEQLFMIAAVAWSYLPTVVDSSWPNDYSLVIQQKCQAIKASKADPLTESQLQNGVRCLDFLYPQATINSYRVDFAWVRRWHRHTDGVFVSTPVVVIECDGHDFHERTKEQAQKDKERDRVLQSLGFNVLRFTGSEIWRDALGCVRSVVEFFDQLASRNYHCGK